MWEFHPSSEQILLITCDANQLGHRNQSCTPEKKPDTVKKKKKSSPPARPASNLSPPRMFIPMGSAFALSSISARDLPLFLAALLPSAARRTWQRALQRAAGAPDWEKHKLAKRLRVSAAQSSPHLGDASFVAVSHHPNTSAASSLLCLRRSLKPGSFMLSSAGSLPPRSSSNRLLCFVIFFPKGMKRNAS